jgi:hypothetical protein
MKNKQIQQKIHRCYFVLIVILFTNLWACKDTNTNIETTATPIEKTESKETVIAQPVDTTIKTTDDIKSDLTYCFTKAIAITSALANNSDYKKGQKIKLSDNPNTEKVERLIKIVANKTNDFQIKKFPKTIKLNFEESCEHTEHEWKLTINKDKKYTLNYFVCQDSDMMDEYCLFNFDISENKYNATYNIWRIVFGDEEESQETKSYEIENDKVIEIKIKKVSN